MSLLYPRRQRRFGRRRFLQAAGVGAAAATLGSWATACGDDDDNGDVLTIGYLTSLSGAATPLTHPERDAVRLAVDEFNENGGILGREVRLIERDDEGSPDAGTRQARDLIENENVFLIYGVISSAVALAVSEVALEAQVPYVNSAAQTTVLTEENLHRYVFRTVPSHTGTVGRAMAIGAAQHEDWQRWYMIGPDYEYGHKLVEDFWEHLSSLRPDVERVGNQWPPFGSGEYSAQITAILAERPDAVFTSLWGEDIIAFIRQAKGFDYFDQVQHTGWLQADPDVAIQLGEDFPPGIFDSSIFSLPVQRDYPVMRSFVEAYQERYGSLPRGGSAFGYTGINFVREAFEAAGEVDREAFIDALEGLTIESVYGTVRMRECDHQAYAPILVGWAEYDPEIGHYALVNPDAITLEEYPELARPCEEIEALRG